MPSFKLLLVMVCVGIVLVPLVKYPCRFGLAVAVHVKVVPGILDVINTSFEADPVQTACLRIALLTLAKGFTVMV